MQHVQTDQDIDRAFDAAYERHGRPLEATHWGEFLAVAPDGRTLVGTDLEDVSLAAGEQFGTGIFVFKIGEIAVGKLR